ncbi:hypothetical protein GIB67_028004 [Kingdonia uniflora]|uniref:Uncharacterized protein n=1 Tax=Kingdonia uniflora TaxID=39325 RepID=A0A7J7L767_9MAGN|nr:hypothetical protein GIB67_028004 [Kingdonia uniflora]
MEGLIKGLINVALDGLGDHNNEDQSRDERSRSSWAQVVLGEQDKDEEGRVGQDYNHWNRNRRNEASEAVGEGYSRRPQKKHEYGNQGGQQNFNQNQWNNKEEGEGKNEIWETVGKKPPKRHPKWTSLHIRPFVLVELDFMT